MVLIGAGEEKKLDELAVQKLGGRIQSFLNAAKIVDATVFFESKDLAQDAANMAFGANLQSYRFNQYFVDKKKDKEIKLQNLSFAVADVSKTKERYKELGIFANNIFMVRDLVSQPSNIFNPGRYAEIF